MEAKNFRLGNWVLDSDREDPSLYQIVRIETKEYAEWNSGSEYNVIAKTEGSEDGYYDIIPSGIPLTEEYLVRFGFNDSEYKEGYIGIEFRTNLILDFVLTKPFKLGEWQKTYVCELGNSRFIQVEYVHELQNLFFAFTTTELELKKLRK